MTAVMLCSVTAVFYGPGQPPLTDWDNLTTPRDADHYIDGKFLVIQQNGYRTAWVQLKAITTIVYWENDPIILFNEDKTPDHTVRLLAGGQSFRLDCKNKDEAVAIVETIVAEINKAKP